MSEPLSRPRLKTLYYYLVYPYLDYCIIVWGSTYKINLCCLVSLQKRDIRIISTTTLDSQSDRIFKEFDLLKRSDETTSIVQTCKRAFT